MEQERPHQDRPQTCPQIIATKLALPPRYLKKIVPRPYIYSLLHSGLHRPLITVTAPAGFGKTTLISEWLRQQEYPVAWVSLEDTDNNLRDFWQYVLNALAHVCPALYVHVETWSSILSQSGKTQEELTTSIETMLTRMINTLMNANQEIILALDDYHTITDPIIHQTMTFLLEHLPPLLHLILITRNDPPLPLARLRVEGKLLELQSSHLRFTLEETSIFLLQAMELDLTKAEVITLAHRTEGWVAGLQLAALALQSRQEQVRDAGNRNRTAITHFIDTFSGTNKHIQTYLTDEVFNQQSAEIQQFLIRTAILDRLQSSLCDAVTGRSDSEAILEQIEHNNLFITPLDNQQQWYRYDYLFKDLLRYRLKQQEPEHIAELHSRASTWYEEHAMIVDAIEHALAAADKEHAANLIEQHAWSFIQKGEEALVHSWLTLLPATMFSTRPMLSFLHACTLLFQAQMDEFEQALTIAETLWQQDKRFDLLSRVYDLRAHVALYRGEGKQAIIYANQTLAVSQEHWLSGNAYVNLGAGYLAQGEIEQASHYLSEGYRISQKYLHIRALHSANIYQGEIALLQGNLRAAMQTFQQILLESDGRTLWCRVAAHTYLADIYREWNDLPSALEQSQQALQVAEQIPCEGFSPARRFQVAAQVAWLQENDTAAMSFLDQAEQNGQRFGPNPTLLAHITALRIHYLLQRGEKMAAQQWFKQYVPAKQDTLSIYAQEAWACAQARLLIDEGKGSEAQQYLEPLYARAHQQQRIQSEIALLLLRTLAYHIEGNTQQTLYTLQQTLMLAEPGGYMRIFIDEGAIMASLLTELYSRYQRRSISEPQNISLGYVYTLLNSFGSEIQPPLWLVSQENEEAMIDKLSEREYMVLGLIAEGLSNQEIAQKLVVTVSTIKTHLNNIYAKLHVHTRLQAVTRAYDLGVLRRSEIDTEPLAGPHISERL